MQPLIAIVAPPNAECLARYLQGCDEAEVVPVVVTPSTAMAEHCAQQRIRCVDIDALDKLPQSSIDALRSMPGLQGLVAVAEFAVEPTENMALALGLPRSLGGSPSVLRNKHEMRQAFAAAGVRQPRLVALARDRSELIAAIASINDYPVICKPVDMAGSWFVTLNESRKDLLSNAEPIFDCVKSRQTGLALAGHCMIEQFVSGAEYSAEVIVVEGEVQFMALTQKTTSPLPYFDEVAHVSGIELPADVLADLGENLRRVIIGANVLRGVLHAEFKVLNGLVYVIEVASRIPGDQISQLVELSYGVVLEHALIRTKMGLGIDICGRQNPIRHGIRFLFDGDAPVTSAAPGVIDARQLPQSPLVSEQALSRTHITRRRGYVIHRGSGLLQPA